MKFDKHSTQVCGCIFTSTLLLQSIALKFVLMLREQRCCLAWCDTLGSRGAPFYQLLAHYFACMTVLHP